MQITAATPADAAELAAIYGYHVVHGTGSYEFAPPDAAEMAARLARIQAAGWPWLVARDDDGAVLGYAYLSQFRDRPAYRYVAENSIYVRHDRHGQGTGKALMAALLVAAEQCGFRQMIAVIGGAGPASMALHAAMGFTLAGRLHAMGRKHGQWLDNVYMQRAIGPGSQTPPAGEPDRDYEPS
ncbi:MAG: N-acetyltransferase [Sphingomonadales bacterium]|nr:N-acetyltransferase [Sphingomonadales bacterium]